MFVVRIPTRLEIGGPLHLLEAQVGSVLLDERDYGVNANDLLFDLDWQLTTSSRYQGNQFRAREAGRTHLRVPKSPEGGRPCRPSRSLVPVYKRFYCFRSNRTLLNFSNFDLSRSCRNLIPPYLRRRRSPAAWLQYTSLIIRARRVRRGALRLLSAAKIMTSLQRVNQCHSSSLTESPAKWPTKARGNIIPRELNATSIFRRISKITRHLLPALKTVWL